MRKSRLHTTLCFHRVEVWIDESEHPITFEELPEYEEERILRMIATDSYREGELYIYDNLPSGEEYIWSGWWWINRDPNAPL